ncbi:MAG: precorrin-6Y C5,15-methyltransferase (decarboxylating) subunit CbiT [Candidatus Accumulibacter sp.]|jgi:cobalt-precorrin-6B (C15)-methyltransferase|nr:precorrin-6Y C5,15-methyltransferase (decarboxylating) subunit CbiT [Accumulibacter sp.]
MTLDWPYLTPGIPDSAFIRGKVPMTKAEVRCVTLSKLRLLPDHVVVDVGAGTGSIAVEAALLCPRGRVYAIERNGDALALIEQNRRRFGVELCILPGEAYEQLDAIGGFDRVIISGSGGRLRDILRVCGRRLSPGGRMVINAVTVETVYRALDVLKSDDYEELDVVSLNVARGRFVGGSTLMEGFNPVYVISATRGDGGAKGET